ncbi:hypothetical protein IKF34_01990 [Candidatus Saccharibacteria bacterium]|nr:hypothetical protein [Candidatus Saccharibacteria bacterium]
MERSRDMGEAARTGPIRGYVKLSSAARAFNFDFRGRTVLDIGSSTGGFTQYALERGAKKVIAVEKGTNQMLPFLRADPRVELHEKTDVFDFKAGVAETYLSKGLRLGRAPRSGPRKIGSDRTPAFDVIMADVSFVSLRKILAHAKAHLADKDTDFLVMLKPQFEAQSDQLKNGIVKNDSLRRQIIKNFEQWLKKHGFVIIKKRDNELKGKTGNVERFYWLKIAK